MKGLATLIRLHKRTLDELRRKMVSLETQKTELQELIKKLQTELDGELLLAHKQVEMAGFFGDFAKRIRKRQQDVNNEIKALDKQMKTLSEEINKAYGEVKKFEIAQENSKRRAKKAEGRKETILFDEIASQQDRRKKGEPV